MLPNNPLPTPIAPSQVPTPIRVPPQSYYMSQWQPKPEAKQAPLLHEALCIVLSIIIYSVAFIWSEARIHGVYNIVLLTFFTSTVIVLFSEVFRDLLAKLMGMHSQYILWPLGVVLVAISSYLGSVFAVPGRVTIEGGSRTTRGIVSASTPLLMLILSLMLIFFSSQYLSREQLQIALGMVLAFGCYEILPIFPLRGSDIWKWSKLIWLMLFTPLYLMYAWFVILA